MAETEEQTGAEADTRAAVGRALDQVAEAMDQLAELPSMVMLLGEDDSDAPLTVVLRETLSAQVELTAGEVMTMTNSEVGRHLLGQWADMMIERGIGLKVRASHPMRDWPGTDE